MVVDPIYRRADGWVWRSFGGSALLMRNPPDAVQLDGAAAVVWTALTSPAAVGDLVQRSPAAWTSAPGDPAVLIAAAIEELVDLGAVEATPSQAAHP